MLRQLLGWLLLAAAMFYLGRSMFELGYSVESRAVFPAWHALLASWMVSLLWLITMGLGWIWVLRFHTGAKSLPSFGTLARVFMHAFVSRYVPGKVWSAVVLCEQLRDQVSPSDVLRSYFLQQLHLFASAAVLAAGVLPWVLSGLPETSAWAPLVVVTAVVAGLVWALLPKTIFDMLGRLPVREKWRQELVFRGSVRQWSAGFALFLLVTALQGLAIVPLWQNLAEAGQQLSILQMIGVVCAYAASRIIGQVAAVAPAGIGVREGAFVLLTNSLSPEVALVSALLLRLLATSVELLAWLVTSLLGRRT